MILKHRDAEVVRFDWVRPFGVKNVELNRSAVQFLPLAFRDRVVGKGETALRHELEEWLLHRPAPLNRQGIANALRRLGFDPENPNWTRELLEFSRGLSLNDVHWLTADDSSETWAKVNLYDNPFSTAVASMAFTGDRHSSVRDASTSPEYSTDGNLRKCWRRVDGRIFLYKAGSAESGGLLGRPNACGFEPFAEYYAAQVAAAMGLEHVTYGLSRFKYRLCSTCPLFTDKKRGYLPARCLIDRAVARQDVRFADIFFFDAVVFNTDRHLGNFGFLVDHDTNEIVAPAPIFDNGYSLFSQAISAPGKRMDEFCDLRLFLSRKSPKLFQNCLDIPGGVTDEMIDRLRNLEKFTFEPHPTFSMPHNRLEMSQYFLQKRIAEIIRYREKADSLLKIARKHVIIRRKEDCKDIRIEIKDTLRSFPQTNTKRLAKLLKVTTRTVARYLKDLQSAGELQRIGSRKTGHWQVSEEVCE